MRLFVAFTCALPMLGQVTPERILKADKEPGNWVTYSGNYSAHRFSPLAIKDKVVVGMAGGEYGVRGFLDAYDAATGKRSWRFWTVPEPGDAANKTWAGASWRTGSATTWVTGAYDPESNLIYWGTGN